MNTCISRPAFVSQLMWTRGGHCYCEPGSPLLSHTSARWSTGTQPEKEPHPDPGGQPHGERPANHLDRVWPDTGPTGIV
jgi:hypothetical protein